MKRPYSPSPEASEPQPAKKSAIAPEAPQPKPAKKSAKKQVSNTVAKIDNTEPTE